MMITDEMIAEDEKRWHARNIVTELGYCGNYMRDLKNITNDDIRFYAYIMRKANAMLKEQEPIPCGEKIKAGDVMLDFYECGYCKNAIRKPWKYCPFCGKEVKWE